ncbi:MAG: Ger(x)C family spore germination C-terminal domain-containing protein [Clostridia bacterium]|nr:Ger(x)C family spore germination C-terminal domain-containing protein [Clostridia bacterium]
MKLFKAKIFMFLIAAVLVFFMSNDFGLIDIENTAIITAIAVDFDGEEYEITAQVAVPENADTQKDNIKAQITGKGYTVGAAIKNCGDLTGWFPKLDFCNLIIIGNEVAQKNVVKILDYFSKTLRIQDSAMVLVSEKKAKDLLTVSTPLDNISAFAIQKAVLKNPGFNHDVADADVKTFIEGYYSDSYSSIMPLVKVVSLEKGEGVSKEGSGGASQGSSNSSSSGEKTDGTSLFDPSSTALFLKGVQVGTLDRDLTLMLNMLTENFDLTTINVGENDVNGDNSNYLLTVKNCEPSLVLTVNDSPMLTATVRLYCKISDVNSGNSDHEYSDNKPLPDSVKELAEKKIKSDVTALFEMQKSTGCDFLKLKEKLYRRLNGKYSLFKDSIVSNFDYTINVVVEGQK